MRKSNTLSLMVLVLLSVNAVLNIRGLPLFAHIGLQALGFYGLAAIGFLIPSSLASAELAARVGKEGGVYAWVSAAFGKKIGFIAIYLEWINNVIGFPATLSTIAATLLYFIFPNVSEHRGVFFLLMMGILWSLTWINLRGVKPSAHFSSLGSLFGTILPGIWVILLGILWFLWQRPIGFLIHSASIFPPLEFSSLSLWVGVMGALSGMQIIGFHFQNIENPKKTFPRVMLISVVLILFLSLGAIFSMSAVVPPQHLNVMAGVIQMYEVFFHSVGWDWILGIFVVLLSFGMMASMNAWILGPARGLQTAAKAGHLPTFFARLSHHQVPRNILIVQSIISSVLALLFLIMPSFKEVFWILIALMGQFTVLMYVLIFASLLCLNFKEKIRPQVIPFGKMGLLVVGLLGLSSCVLAFMVGVFPPAQLGFPSTSAFVWRMVFIDGLILGVPFLLSLKLWKE